MRAVVIYESMYGPTHEIADAIGSALKAHLETLVLSVHAANPETMADPDLIVVGAPTQQHGLSLPLARADTVSPVHRGNVRGLDAGAGGIGIREWLTDLPPLTGHYAAFDTRAPGPQWRTGSAGNRIDSSLRHSGLTRLARPQSFFIMDAKNLQSGEQARAASWGTLLTGQMLALLR